MRQIADKRSELKSMLSDWNTIPKAYTLMRENPQLIRELPAEEFYRAFGMIDFAYQERSKYFKNGRKVDRFLSTALKLNPELNESRAIQVARSTTKHCFFIRI